MNVIFYFFFLLGLSGISTVASNENTEHFLGNILCDSCLTVVELFEKLLKENKISLLEDVSNLICYLSPNELQDNCRTILKEIINIASQLVNNGEELLPVCYMSTICA